MAPSSRALSKAPGIFIVGRGSGAGSKIQRCEVRWRSAKLLTGGGRLVATLHQAHGLVQGGGRGEGMEDRHLAGRGLKHTRRKSCAPVVNEITRAPVRLKNRIESDLPALCLEPIAIRSAWRWCCTTLRLPPCPPDRLPPVRRLQLHLPASTGPLRAGKHLRRPVFRGRGAAICSAIEPRAIRHISLTRCGVAHR